MKGSWNGMALADTDGKNITTFQRIKLALEWLAKKTIYLILSAALMAFLASSFVADATALLLTENVGKTTQRFTFTIFVSFVTKSIE